ncbi:unnamed protein product [Tenebrio molitor]|nr:unnamed protein product [Tenebrio molitor]
METPPSPVPKTKTKKRRRTEKSTPQSQLEQLVADIKAQEAGQVEFAELAVEPAVLEARADEVTLREAHVPHGELAHEEFGILGVFQPLEGEPLPEFVREQEGVPQPPSSKVGEETVVPLVQEKVVPVELASKVTSSTESEGAPRTITVEAQVHVSAQVEPSKRAPRGEPDSLSIQTSQVAVETPAEVQEFRVEQSEEVQQLGEELRKIESITRARPILGQMQIGAVEDRDTQIQLRRIRKKNDEDLAKLVINVKQSRVVRINRCEPNEVEWIDINPCPLPEVNIKVPNLTNLVNMYLIRDDRDLVKRRKTSEGASLRDSLPLQRKSGRVTPPAEFLTEATVIPPLLEERVEEQPVAEVHVIADTLQLPTETQVPEPLLASTPVIRKETEIAQKTVEEVMHVTVEEQAVSPRKKRKLADMEPQFEKELDFITLPTDLPSGELTVSALTIAQQTVDSVPVPVVTEQSRQQDIVHKVFIKGRCTLEEVSQRPINKLNIARAFNDILGMSVIFLAFKNSTGVFSFVQVQLCPVDKRGKIVGTEIYRARI